MMLRLLFALFILMPLIELYFLIQVGQVIGAGWTIVAVIGTAILGAMLLRVQGLSTLFRAQDTLRCGQIPAIEMMEGIVLAISGLFLLTPGFLTDTAGFILLIPSARQWLIKKVLQQSEMRIYRQSESQGTTETVIIEGEIIEQDKRLK